MKTTIDIPEPLYKRVKSRAIEQGVTLGEIVLHSLEREMGPETGTESAGSPWANRKLLPGFRQYWESGEISAGTDSTQIISEGRDGR